MVVKYRNQNYSKLKRDHQRSGQLFTDPEFPPTNESLFISGKSDEEIVWKRPGVSTGVHVHYTQYTISFRKQSKLRGGVGVGGVVG